jgi:hypothetical protein
MVVESLRQRDREAGRFYVIAPFLLPAQLNATSGVADFRIGNFFVFLGEREL